MKEPNTQSPPTGDRLDLDAIRAYLAGGYWCREIPRQTLERAGLARAITDSATYAYL